MNNKESEIMVSVICNTYNHEKYVEDALKGFVMQRTNFEFEVLVHDDASKDFTANIIRKYEELYPNLIKPIYQEVNQYSQGISIAKNFQFPRVKGKYIAICEGDDYWTDPYKLQKQVDVLERYPEINICVCKASLVENGKEVEYIPESCKEQIFPVQDVIAKGGGMVMTASIMYRSCINQNMPKFREKMGFDYTIQIHGALNGGMYYIPDNMVVYRYNTDGSWTSRMKKDEKASISWNMRVIEMLQILDGETKGQYSETIHKKIAKNKFDILYMQNEYKEIMKMPYKEIFLSYPILKRINMQIKMRFPFLRKIFVGC